MRDEDLPDDLDDLPTEAPPGADPVLWRLAQAVYDAHRPRADGFCACKKFWPCDHAMLAGDHLRKSHGVDPTMLAEAPLHREPLHRESSRSRWVLLSGAGCRISPVDRLTSRPSRQRRRNAGA
jgi:hypothetical protein